MHCLFVTGERERGRGRREGEREGEGREGGEREGEERERGREGGGGGASHSLVLLAIISQYQVLESHLNSDPLLIIQCGPYVVGLRYCSLVRFEDDLCPLRVHMEGT